MNEEHNICREGIVRAVNGDDISVEVIVSSACSGCHAKSICLNFGTAQKYGGVCNVRYDDTNPVAEDIEFVKAGFEVEMDPQYANKPYRYIRFVIRKNREPSAQIQLSELKFWGAYQE